MQPVKKLLPVLVLCMACDPSPSETDADVPRGDAPAALPETPALHRLTATQYRHAMRDLFGEGLALPARLEPDERIDGLFAVGSAHTTISSYGAERYAEAAYDVATQVLADAERRERWVDCELTEESCRQGRAGRARSCRLAPPADRGGAGGHRRDRRRGRAPSTIPMRPSASVSRRC